MARARRKPAPEPDDPVEAALEALDVEAKKLAKHGPIKLAAALYWALQDRCPTSLNAVAHFLRQDRATFLAEVRRFVKRHGTVEGG